MGFGFGGDIRLPQRRDWLLDRVVETGSIVMKRVGGGRAGEMAGHWFISHEDVTPHSILGDVYARRRRPGPPVLIFWRGRRRTALLRSAGYCLRRRGLSNRASARWLTMCRAPPVKSRTGSICISRRTGSAMSRPAGIRTNLPASASIWWWPKRRAAASALWRQRPKLPTGCSMTPPSRPLPPCASSRERERGGGEREREREELTNAQRRRGGRARARAPGPPATSSEEAWKKVAEKQMNPQKEQPQTTPAHIAWICARIGGWNCCGKPPGPKTMAHGWKSLMLMLQAVRHRKGRSTCVNPAATREWSSLSALP